MNITQEPGPDPVPSLTSLPLVQELCRDTQVTRDSITVQGSYVEPLRWQPH